MRPSLYDFHYDPDVEVIRCREALRGNPQDALAHACLGDAWYQKAFRSRRRDEWEQARASLELGVAAFPDKAHLYVKLSQAYWGLGDRVKALQVAEQAVTADRLNTRCYRNLARMQRGSGHWRSYLRTMRTWFGIEYRRSGYDNGENGPLSPEKNAA